MHLCIIPPMGHHIPTLLLAVKDRLGITQAELAMRLSLPGRNGLKITQPQVSRWLRGQEPERENYERIIAVAEEIGILGDVQSEDVAAATEPSPTDRVKIKGYVGTGDKAHFYAVADDDFEEVDAPGGANDQTIALQIKGKSWGPAMDSWLVFYDDVRSPVTPDLLGQACVVGLADDRILLKVIRSNGKGGFDLHPNSTTEKVIRDAEIEWAAKVVGMRPR